MYERQLIMIIELTDSELKEIHDAIEEAMCEVSFNTMLKLKCPSVTLVRVAIIEGKLDEILNNEKIKKMLPICTCEDFHQHESRLWICSIHGEMTNEEYVKECKIARFHYKVRDSQTEFLREIELHKYLQ